MKSNKGCKAEGCEKKHFGKGFCKKHWTQLSRYGKILKRTKADPNEIVIKRNIAEVVLYNNKSREIARAIIDSEDVEKVSKYKWYLNNKHVSTRIKNRGIGIQCIILGIKTDRHRMIDHKDRNPLNNRKSNLRSCIKKENSSNRGKHKNNTSGFKGVCKLGKSWRVVLCAGMERIYLGTFKKKGGCSLGIQ